MVAKLKPLAPVRHPDDDLTIFYPETDGMPLPDALEQEREFVDVNVTLRGYYAHRPNAFVSGNTFVYYDRRDARHNVSPDCYVAFDVDVAALYEANRYRVWAVGKPPDFALEIASPSTAENDLHDKRERYAIVGIGEYWRYDPTGGDYYGEPLVGEYLGDGEYRRFELHPGPDGMVWAHSPTLELDVCYTEERLWLYDPATGEWLGNVLEQQAGRLAAEAEVVRLREQRLAAEAEVARLQAELQRLRGE